MAEPPWMPQIVLQKAQLPTQKILIEWKPIRQQTRNPDHTCKCAKGQDRLQGGIVVRELDATRKPVVEISHSLIPRLTSTSQSCYGEQWANPVAPSSSGFHPIPKSRKGFRRVQNASFIGNGMLGLEPPNFWWNIPILWDWSHTCWQPLSYGSHYLFSKH